MKELDSNNPTTASGRKMTPTPKIDASSSRKLINTIKRVEKWLLENAFEEVSGDSYKTSLLKAISLDNMSTSDRDTINLILFNRTETMIKY